MEQSTDDAYLKVRAFKIGYILGALDGLSVSTHKDVDHYHEQARDLAKYIRCTWLTPENQKN